MDEFQKYLISVIDNAGEFLGAELPEIANQILTYNLVVSITLAVVFMLVAAGLFLASRYSYKRSIVDDIHYVDKEGFKMDMVSTGIVSGFSLLMAISRICEIIKITLAPKLYLLEYAAGLVK